MFRWLESIRADSHQQQHTHPTLTYNMSSSSDTTKQPPFPLYLLPSLSFRRKNKDTKFQAPTSAVDTPTKPSDGSSGWPTSQATPISQLSTPPYTSLPTASAWLASTSSLANNITPNRSILATSLPTASAWLANTGSSASNITPDRSRTGTSAGHQPRTPISPAMYPELHPNDLPLTPTSTLPTPSTSSPFSNSSPFSATSTALTTPSTSPPSTSAYTKLGSFPLNDSPIGFDSTSPTPPYSPLGLNAHTPTLRCLYCSTDIAYASQIISKGFTGRHGRAYLLSPLPPKPSVPGAQNCATTNSPQVPQTSRFNLLDPFGSFSSSHSYEDEDEGDEKKERYNLLNIETHTPARRQLVTGLHVVADIACRVCGKVLGWKYVDASEPSQRYKIGKFILETKRVVRHEAYEDDIGAEVDDESRFGSPINGPSGRSPPAALFMSPQKQELTRAASVKGKGREEAMSFEERFGAEPALPQKEKGYDSNGEIEFDSEDEEEREEIFAGTWDREFVRRRREKRAELARKMKTG